MLATIVGRVGFLGRLRYLIWVRYQHRLIQFTMVTAAIGLTLVSAFLLEKNLILGMLPMVGFVGLFAAILFYYQMEATALLIIVTSTILKEGVSTGTETKITFTFIMLALTSFLWIFRLIFVKSSRGLRPSPANTPAILFIVVVLISLFWSTVFVDYAVSFRYAENVKPRLMSTVAFVLSPMAYLLYANLVHSDKGIRFFVIWFVVVGGIFAIFRLANALPPIFNDRGQMPVWVAALAGGQALFNRNLKPWMILALLAITGMWGYSQFALGITWLSGWLPLALVLGLFLFIRSWRLFLVFVAIGAFVMVLNLDSVMETFNAENDESGHTRLDAWIQIIELSRDHLLFGVGPTGYAPYLWTYVGDFMATHNNYLDMLAQLGVVGFFLYIWFWFAVVWFAWKTYRIAPRNGFYHGLAVALLASNIATLAISALGDWVIPFAYTQGIAGIDYTIWPWLLAGLTVATHYQMRSQIERELETVAPESLPAGYVVSLPAHTT
ncbi:MAG: O-antigen ligase family protein [Anaerolineaceae bacterium]|nr:O-antigen ligase family protein [Anaerolineaceae bacterium]